MLSQSSAAPIKININHERSGLSFMLNWFIFIRIVGWSLALNLLHLIQSSDKILEICNMQNFCQGPCSVFGHSVWPWGQNKKLQTLDRSDRNSNILCHEKKQTQILYSVIIDTCKCSNVASNVNIAQFQLIDWVGINQSTLSSLSITCHCMKWMACK